MERRTIDEIQVAAEPGAWRAAGFNVAGHVCEVGSARLRLLGEGPSRGIVSWSVRGPGSGSGGNEGRFRSTWPCQALGNLLPRG